MRSRTVAWIEGTENPCLGEGGGEEGGRENGARVVVESLEAEEFGRGAEEGPEEVFVGFRAGEGGGRWRWRVARGA